MKKWSIIVVLVFLYSKSFAQYNIRDTVISFPMIGATFAYQFPGGDLAKRFGNNYNVGGVFQWKLRNNWVIGIEANFIFSENVKEAHILDALATSDGYIIDGGGKYADVEFHERGWKTEFKASKILSVIGPNKNSGILLALGAGILQHKIRIETPGSPVPSLEGEYSKGYDRLTNGLSITQFLGYINFGNRRLVNFYGGIEVTEAFTQNRREFNFDTHQHDGMKRLDILAGIRLGWVIPMYKRSTDKFYIN